MKLLLYQTVLMSFLKTMLFSLFQVLSRNEYKPSLSADYSILKLGNGIKGISNNATFKYMLDAHQRNHYGGIWEAKIEYS